MTKKYFYKSSVAFLAVMLAAAPAMAACANGRHIKDSELVTGCVKGDHISKPDLTAKSAAINYYVDGHSDKLSADAIVGVDRDGNVIRKNGQGKTYYLQPSSGDFVAVKNFGERSANANPSGKDIVYAEETLLRFQWQLALLAHAKGASDGDIRGIIFTPAILPLPDGESVDNVSVADVRTAIFGPVSPDLVIDAESDLQDAKDAFAAEDYRKASRLAQSSQAKTLKAATDWVVLMPTNGRAVPGTEVWLDVDKKAGDETPDKSGIFVRGSQPVIVNNSDSFAYTPWLSKTPGVALKDSELPAGSAKAYHAIIKAEKSVGQLEASVNKIAENESPRPGNRVRVAVGDVNGDGDPAAILMRSHVYNEYTTDSKASVHINADGLGQALVYPNEKANDPFKDRGALDKGARSDLQDAKDAFSVGNYGKAFGLANAAQAKTQPAGVWDDTDIVHVVHDTAAAPAGKKSGQGKQRNHDIPGVTITLPGFSGSFGGGGGGP